MNEDLKINPHTKKYIVTFKRKDQRQDKRSDKVDILKGLMGIGDYENYVNISALRMGDKYHNYNKITSSGRNEDDRFNPIAPNTETIHDINRYELPVVMVKLNHEQLKNVRKDPNILRVEEDAVNHHCMSSITVTPPQQTPWGVNRVTASEAWLSSGNNKKGRGVHVGVIDTGILFTHPDLADNYLGGVTVVPGTNSPLDEGSLEEDKSFTYHGTHVAGTIAAVDNDQGVVGVAAEAFLYSARIFTPKSRGTTITLEMAAMEWCMNHDLQITNNSYGGYTFTQAQKDQWQQAFDQFGMINIASAGNDGDQGAKYHDMDPNDPNKIQSYPSGYPGAIEISALQESGDSIVDWSNYGKKTEFAAPGVSVLSTGPGNVKRQVTGTAAQTYSTLNGTSMAAPHVSGFFALALSNWRYHPCADMYKLSTKKNEVLRTVARQTADKKGLFPDRDPNNAFGYGVIDADALVKKLLNPDITTTTIA
jgi:subtilisin